MAATAIYFAFRRPTERLVRAGWGLAHRPVGSTLRRTRLIVGASHGGLHGASYWTHVVALALGKLGLVTRWCAGIAVPARRQSHNERRRQ